MSSFLRAACLVAWTGGNLSAREQDTGLVAIKPSAVRYEDLTPEKMVIVDLDGNVVETELQPSSDTATHRTFTDIDRTQAASYIPIRLSPLPLPQWGGQSCQI